MTRDDFDKLIHKISRKLYGQAFRMLRDREGSEDAVQEILLKLWKMNTKLHNYESVEALATTMTKNYCIDQIRKLKYIEKSGENAFTLYHDPDPSPHDKVERSETSDILRRIISNLPEIYRKLIQLRDIDEFSYEEIADMTGQNINSLRVNLSRARKIVRDEYKKYIDEF